MSLLQEPFFVAGGTVPPDSPSYVERAADRELYESLLSGEYCYVLNSRQMGKSSLAVRTVARLQEAGVRTAFVDLTRIGGANVSAEQWFSGLLAETGRVLELRQEAVKFLREHKEMGPAQRYLSFLHESALVSSDSPLVLMLDEIDAVRSLSFSTDELFAGIRQLHNGRASDPVLKRLTLCLLGAALPSDLIRDARTTPFNVGRRIELRDFSMEEAKALERGLPDSQSVVRRVLSWTGGHPFLTQTLCATLASIGTPTPQAIDALVRERYLDARAKETDTNLADVGNRLLGRGDPSFGEAERADTLSLYAKLLKSGIPDDESNPSCARIKMSGVARLESGKLTIRNRIYKDVFGPVWVRENMPGQELRRQRRAFWKGAVRTGGIAALVVATIGSLAWNNARLARIAEDGRRRAEYDTYIASMRALPMALQESNYDEINRTLDGLKNSPHRGWEWRYWHHVANSDGVGISLPNLNVQQHFSPSGRFLVAITASADRLYIIDVDGGHVTRSFPVKLPTVGAAIPFFVGGDDRIVVASPNGWLTAFDVGTGRELARRRHPGLIVGVRAQFGRNALVGVQKDLPVVIDGETLDIHRPWKLSEGSRGLPSASPSGRFLSWIEVATGKDGVFRLVTVRTSDGKEVDSVNVSLEDAVDPAVSPDDRHVATANTDGSVTLRDIVTHESRKLAAFSVIVASVEFSPNGRQVLASSTTRTAKLFDLATRKVVREFPDAGYVGFTPSGRSLYTSYNTFRIYRTGAKPEVKEFSPPHPWKTSGLNRNGQFRYWNDGVASTVDLTDERAKPQRFPFPARLGAFMEHGDQLLIRLTQSSTALEFVRRGFKIPDLRVPLPQGGTPLGIDVSSDGKWIAYGSQIYDRRRRDSEAGPVATLPHDAAPAAAWFSDDSRWLVTGDQSGLVTLWRSGQWKKPVWNFRDRSGGYLAVARMSPDGKRVALGLWIDEGVILDTQTGRPVLRLVGHSQTLRDIGWSPDGRRLVTCSNDRTVRLWDAVTGCQICILGQQDSAVTRVMFLPGGRTVAALGRNVILYKSEARR